MKPEARNEVSKTDLCHSRKTCVTFEPTPELKYKFKSRDTKLSFRVSGDQEWMEMVLRWGSGLHPSVKVAVTITNGTQDINAAKEQIAKAFRLPGCQLWVRFMFHSKSANIKTLQCFKTGCVPQVTTPLSPSWRELDWVGCMQMCQCCWRDGASEVSWLSGSLPYQ